MKEPVYLFGCLPIVIIVVILFRACSMVGDQQVAVVTPGAAPAPAQVDPTPEPIPDRGPEERVIDFYATWCGPCKAAMPTVDRLEKAGHKIIRIDVDDNRSTCRMFNVSSVPTFIITTDGKETFRTHDVRALEARLKQ
jgi:thiol-disulfide isomerase/thioredoxin